MLGLVKRYAYYKSSKICVFANTDVKTTEVHKEIISGGKPQKKLKKK